MYVRSAKKYFDFIFSAFLLILLSPLFLLLLAMVFLDQKGKVFFIQDRTGKEEEIFRIIKFRTMLDHPLLHGCPLPDAVRTTKIGNWLRHSRLDELPQLINILKGDMSFIGPRPLLPQYVARYPNHVREKRHTVKPGITGLAQLNGADTLAWEERFKLDLEYIDQSSFLLDLQILVKTAFFVFTSKKGTSAGEYSKESNN